MDTALDSRHVEEFLTGRGGPLLELLGERPLAGAAWSAHSHGGVVPVATPYPGVFDRLVVVLVRPENQPVEAFRAWAEPRFGQLDRYLQAANTGRVVRTLPSDACFAGVVMRRAGRDPGDADTELPPLRAFPKLLGRFARDVERYVRTMGDEDLRYVGGLRLHLVPRREGGPRHLLGLDPLPTVLGLRGAPLPLSPVTLVRGVALEMAALVRSRGEALRLTRTLSPIAALRRSHLRHQHEALAEGLEGVAERLDGAAVEATLVARWLEGVRVPWMTPPVRAIVAIDVVAIAGVAVWLWVR